MKKQDSVFAACLTGSLVCGLAGSAPAQNSIQPQPTKKVPGDFSQVPVSRAGESGSIASDPSPDVVRALRASSPAEGNSASTPDVSAGKIATDADRKFSAGSITKGAALNERRGSEKTSGLKASRMDGVGTLNQQEFSIERHAVSTPPSAENFINPESESRSRLLD